MASGAAYNPGLAIAEKSSSHNSLSTVSSLSFNLPFCTISISAMSAAPLLVRKQGQKVGWQHWQSEASYCPTAVFFSSFSFSKCAFGMQDTRVSELNDVVP